MSSHDPLRRPRRTFWVLAVVAVAAAGSVSTALAEPADPLTGLRFAVSGLILAVAIVLAGRVMTALERARRRARSTDSTQ